MQPGKSNLSEFAAHRGNLQNMRSNPQSATASKSHELKYIFVGCNSTRSCMYNYSSRSRVNTCVEGRETVCVCVCVLEERGGGEREVVKRKIMEYQQ